jgi:lipopolysaccharide/colanic/teichoic acid biosynthesis glycosyltransferase
VLRRNLDSILALWLLMACLPIFFRHERVGQRGKPFIMVKLDSMISASDVTHRQITRVGAVFRHLTVDELPRLAPVPKGDRLFFGSRAPRQHNEVYCD